MTAFMSDAQVPDPHLDPVDADSVSTVEVFAPDVEQTPVLTSLSPDTVVAGDVVLVTVTGENFTERSIVFGSGMDTQSEYVDPTTLVFYTKSNMQPGTTDITVSTPTGYESASLPLTMT